MKQILNIAHYEMLHIFKDKILFLMVFIVPLLYASLFGTIYLSGTLQHVPLAIVDLDHSQDSQTVTNTFANTPHFKLVEGITTYAEMEEGMKNGQIRAGVVIPEDYSKKLSQHQSTQILAVYDGSNLIYGFNTRKYFNEVLTSLSSERTASYLAGLGMTNREIRNTMDTVSCNMEVWYNPTFSYTSYIFMGYILLILHQIGLLSIGLTVTREKERNSWIQYLCSAVPQWKIFLGKAMPYYIVNFFNYALLLWLSAYLINVKIGGSLAIIILLGLIYDLIITSTGFCVSVHAPNSLQVTRYLMLLSIPFFILSGYTWPKTYIPQMLNAVARLFPYTWMSEGFRLVTLKGLGISYLYPTIIALTIIASLATFLAMTFPKRRKTAESKLTVNCQYSYPKKRPGSFFH